MSDSNVNGMRNTFMSSIGWGNVPEQKVDVEADKRRLIGFARNEGAAHKSAHAEAKPEHSAVDVLEDAEDATDILREANEVWEESGATVELGASEGASLSAAPMLAIHVGVKVGSMVLDWAHNIRTEGEEDGSKQSDAIVAGQCQVLGLFGKQPQTTSELCNREANLAASLPEPNKAALRQNMKAECEAFHNNGVECDPADVSDWWGRVIQDNTQQHKL